MPGNLAVLRPGSIRRLAIGLCLLIVGHFVPPALSQAVRSNHLAGRTIPGAGELESPSSSYQRARREQAGPPREAVGLPAQTPTPAAGNTTTNETQAALESIAAEARARAAQVEETQRAKARAGRASGGRPSPPGYTTGRGPHDPRARASQLAQARWTATQRAAAVRRAQQAQRMRSMRLPAGAMFLAPVLRR